MQTRDPHTQPLRRQSILVIDDDALSAFQLRRHLVKAGARVVSGGLAESAPYLEAAALAAVVVGRDLNASDRARLRALLRTVPAPWIAYGAPAGADVSGAAAHVPAGDVQLLIETLAALVGGLRH